MNDASACRTFRNTIARDDLDAGTQARMKWHAEHCESCSARAEGRAAMRKAVLETDDHLDDLTRARVLARLGRTIDDVALVRVHRGARGINRWAWRLGLASAAMALVLVGLHLSKRKGSSPTNGIASAAPGRVLTPYTIEAAPNGGMPALGKALDHLELPAQSTLLARLADIAELTLVGPLELEVTSANRDRVELNLARGTLIADFDGSRGGTLLVRGGGVVVEVVGTLFSVESQSDRTRVSVAHGRVKVAYRNQAIVLTDGQSWRTDHEDVEPLSRSMVRLFEQASHGLGEQATPSTMVPTKIAPSVTRVKSPRGTIPRRVAHSRLEAMVDGPSSSTSSPNTPPPDPVPMPAISSWAPTPPTPIPAPRQAATEPEKKTPNNLPPPDPATLYRQAETALQKGDDTRGMRLLTDLIARFPTDSSADAARFEMALVFQKAGKHHQAIALADALSRGPAKGPFTEPARFLRCRLERDRGQSSAALACLQRFTTEFPQSPHHAQALRMSCELHVEAGQCAQAISVAKRYLAAYPRGSFATQAGRIEAECGR